MYSKELIEEVKEVYPGFTDMIEYAEKENLWLGRILDDAAQNSIFKPEDILIADSLEQLQNVARFYIRKIELYKKWCLEDPETNNIKSQLKTKKPCI